MRRTLFAAAVVLAAFAVSGSACNQGGITPAESELLGCDTYSGALTQLAALRAQGKLNEGTVEIVDHVRSTLNPICLGPAPDVNATVKDVVVDAGVRSLQSIIANVF